MEGDIKKLLDHMKKVHLVEIAKNSTGNISCKLSVDDDLLSSKNFVHEKVIGQNGESYTGQVGAEGKPQGYGVLEEKSLEFKGLFKEGYPVLFGSVSVQKGDN
jgi:hypothetical protein